MFSSLAIVKHLHLCSLMKRVPANQRQKKSVPLSRWKPSQYKSKAGFFFFIVHFLIKESKGLWWEERTMDKGSDFKHFGVGSVLDVVLDDWGMKRLFCVPIPFCYHTVTASLALVLVICSSLCACVLLRNPSHPFLSTSIDWYSSPGRWMALPRMLVMCLSNLLWWQYFLYKKKKNTVDF